MIDVALDVPRYEGIINGALGQREKIERYADELHNKGFKNIFFIGVGGTYAHFTSLQSIVESHSTLDSYVVIAAEFMAKGHKHFSKDSLCIMASRSGTTKEIIEAAKFCKEAGATVVMYTANAGTPVCDLADYLFVNFAEDDNFAESFFLIYIPFMFRLMHHRGEFPRCGEFMDQVGKITPYLVEAKKKYDDRCRELAEKHKDTNYHMIVGSGNMWGQAYFYAMCILEEMQWIHGKAIRAAEFFHGTLELVEEGTSILMLYGEDETRPLMDRVLNFAKQFTKEIAIFDSKDIELPVDEEFRGFLSPIVVYALTERFSIHLSKVRNHPLTTRRYYRRMDY